LLALKSLFTRTPVEKIFLMKYLNLMVLSVALANSFCSCSNLVEDCSSNESKSSSETVNMNEKMKFNDLPVDMLFYLNSFLEIRDQFSLKNVNSFSRNNLTLKNKVKQTFNISGLENFDDNEPELASVMRLAWISHDPSLFFAALMEEVSCEKKPYEVLFRPLVLHLARTFHALRPQEKQDCQQHFDRRFHVSVERYLAKICTRKGHYDLVFEVARDDAQVLRDFVVQFENRIVLMELFRDNPDYATQYLDTLLTNANNNMDYSVEEGFGRWMSECIIQNLPQSYYEILFTVGGPIGLKVMISHLCLSVNVPETEYARIHEQIFNILNKFLNEPEHLSKLEDLGMINDIRFGSFDLNDFRAVNFHSIGFEFQLLLTKAALLANKRDMFFDFYAKYKLIVGEIAIDRVFRFKELNVYSFQAKNFKMIFDRIQNDPIDFFSFRSDFKFIEFMTKFYAFEHLKFDHDRDIVIFEFVASKNLSEFEFPPVLLIEGERRHAGIFIDCIFGNMSVFDEQSITSVMNDLVQYYKNIANLHVRNPGPGSYKVIEFISNFPILLNFMLENGIKLYATYNFAEDLGNYFKLPNFEFTCQIMEWTNLSEYTITSLKTQDHLARLEVIKNLNVCQIFLLWDSLFNRNEAVQQFGQNFVKLIYFEWRVVFAYWLKCRAGEGMQQIRTPEFIEMLKLDFPNETRQLFPLEGEH
jgi:hypothetical protein